MATARSCRSGRPGPEEQGCCGIRRRVLPGAPDRLFAVSEVRIQGARRHRHPATWELYIVKSGKGTIEVGDLVLDVGPGDVVEIPPGVAHRALAAPELTVLVVMAPGSAEDGGTELVED